MSAADGLSASAGSGQPALPSPRPGRGARGARGAPGDPASCRGQADGLAEPGWRPRRCMVAAGMAVAVVLCLSWGHGPRITSGSAALDDHAVQATARIRFAGTGVGDCVREPAVSPGRLLGQDSAARGGDGPRHALAQVLQAPLIPIAGPSVSMAGPGSACPAVRRWSQVRPRAVSSEAVVHACPR